MQESFLMFHTWKAESNFPHKLGLGKIYYESLLLWQSAIPWFKSLDYLDLFQSKCRNI